MYEKLMGLALLGVLGSAGVLAILMADEPRGGGVTVARWLQHDRGRPHPPVVEPAKSSAAAPGDATILFDGKDFDQWQGEEGGPRGGRWSMARSRSSGNWPDHD